MQLRVVSWSLESGRASLGEATRVLIGGGWDLALLRAVPARRPDDLGRALGAEQRVAVVARLLPAPGREAAVILARSDRIIAQRAERLGRRPGGRVLHAAQLACGLWAVNLGAWGESEADSARAARLAAEWARGGPVLLGGAVQAAAAAEPGFMLAAQSGEVRLLVAGGVQAAAGSAAVLRTGAAVAVTLST